MRKFFRFLLGMLVLLAVLLAAAWGIVAWQLNRPAMLEKASGYLTRATGRESRVGGLRLGIFPPSLALRDVRVGNEGESEYFWAEAVQVALDWRTRAFRSVRLEAPGAFIRLKEAETLAALPERLAKKREPTVAHPPETPKETPEAEWVEIEEVVVSRGRVQVVAESAGNPVAPVFSADGVDLRASRLRIGGGTLEWEQGTLTAAMGTAGAAPFSKLDVQAGLSANRLMIPRFYVDALASRIEGAGKVLLDGAEPRVVVESLRGEKLDLVPALLAFGVPWVEGYSGLVDASVSGEGYGLDWRKWTGTVDFSAPAVTYTGLGGSPADHLVLMLSGTPLPEVSRPVRRRIEEARQALVTVKRVQIDDVKVAGRIDQGNIQADEVSASCESIGFLLSGRLNPDVETMALEVRLTGFDMSIPFRLAGTFDAPEVELEINLQSLTDLIPPKHVDTVNAFLGALLGD